MRHLYMSLTVFHILVVNACCSILSRVFLNARFKYCPFIFPKQVSFFFAFHLVHFHTSAKLMIISQIKFYIVNFTKTRCLLVMFRFYEGTRADAALYQAKRNGRNQLVVADLI